MADRHCRMLMQQELRRGADQGKVWAERFGDHRPARSAIESPAFGRPPETQPPDCVGHNSGVWMIRQMLDAYGYKDKSVELDPTDGSLRAEQVAEPGSRYILGGNWASVRDVANLVASATGKSAPIITVPLRTAIAAAPLIPYLARFTGGQPIFTEASLRALDSNRQINHQAAVRDLGYKVRPLAETVRDALAWFNRNHYL